MSFLRPSFLTHIPIPPKRRSLYTALRALLYAGFLSITSIIGYSFLFPSQGFVFDFRNPDAAKNTLLDPRNSQGIPERKGSIAENNTLTVSNGALGIFSHATTSLTLKKDSPAQENTIVTAYRGYREIFLPEGQSAEFPHAKKIQSLTFEEYRNGGLFRVQGDIYQLFDGILYRFASETAALTRYESSDIIDQETDFLTRFPLSEEWIGFRPGTLISFADGVFVVYGETDIRPVGSAEIFQAIGYDWADVIPASEEETSMYRRGRIILPGTLHAPGTLFQIIETGNYFTIDAENFRRPIMDKALLQFFLSRTHAIPVSKKSLEIKSTCSLKKSLFFTRDYECDIALQNMQSLPGNDYQFTITPQGEARIESLQVIMKRSPEKGNFRATLSQLKTRLLDRYSK